MTPSSELLRIRVELGLNHIQLALNQGSVPVLKPTRVRDSASAMERLEIWLCCFPTASYEVTFVAADGVEERHQARNCYAAKHFIASCFERATHRQLECLATLAAIDAGPASRL